MPKPKKPKKRDFPYILQRVSGSLSGVVVPIENANDINGTPIVLITQKDPYGRVVAQWASEPDALTTQILPRGGKKSLYAVVRCTLSALAKYPCEEEVVATTTAGATTGTEDVEVTIVNPPPSGGGGAEPSDPENDEAVLFP